MDSSRQQSTDPALCVGGCGFFGSEATQGYCSVCWKSHMAAASQAASAPAAASPAPAADVQAAPQPAEAPQQPAAEAAEAATPAADAAAAPPAASDAPQAADDKPVQANRSRCFCCRKKVGLLGFECRCGYVFCSGHRHAQDHACTFDYASFDKANLAKANSKVVAAKVDKL